MDLPSAIIFINSDLSELTKLHLTNQLFIDEVMSDEEFDNRVDVDPNYADNVRGQNLRILVVRDDFRDYNNRDLADIVVFFSKGQVYIEKNKFGPPGLTLSVQRLNIWALLRGVNSSEVPILPSKSKTLTECDCPPMYGLGGIVAIELRDTGISACKNPDNIYNNEAFINRK